MVEIQRYPPEAIPLDQRFSAPVAQNEASTRSHEPLSVDIQIESPSVRLARYESASTAENYKNLTEAVAELQEMVRISEQPDNWTDPTTGLTKKEKMLARQNDLKVLARRAGIDANGKTAAEILVTLDAALDSTRAQYKENAQQRFSVVMEQIEMLTELENRIAKRNRITAEMSTPEKAQQRMNFLLDEIDEDDSIRTALLEADTGPARAIVRQMLVKATAKLEAISREFDLLGEVPKEIAALNQLAEDAEAKRRQEAEQEAERLRRIAEIEKHIDETLSDADQAA